MFLPPGQRRNRDVHVALSVGDDPQILGVESNAEQAQFVDRDTGGDAGGRSGKLGGGRRPDGTMYSGFAPATGWCRLMPAMSGCHLWE